jgi:hypothetical protein
LISEIREHLKRPGGIMTVTHNGKQYTAKKLNDNEWQLTSVSAPREKLTLNRWQMHIAGLLEQVEVKMMHHYGTTPLIRQCVTPGMMAMHEGRTYRVSAVIQERKWVYLHTDAEIIRLSDCVIDVLLDGHGNPIQH